MSTEEVKTTSDVKTQEKAVKFGNSDLSDVIFVFDGKEFHCHKILLAAKCDYFASMFASGFKEKDQERIKIDADKIAFERLLEIIYNGYIFDAEEIMQCDSYVYLNINFEQYNRRLWKTTVDLFALADRFLLTDDVRDSFELVLVRYDRECPNVERKCHHCAVKLLLALCFGMNDYKEICVTSKETVKEALKRLPGDIHMSTEAMAFLLERI